MTKKLLGVVAALALLFSANSTAQAVPFDGVLPLNGTVYFTGNTLYPTVWLNPGSIGIPTISPPCFGAIGSAYPTPACTPEQNALQGALAITTTISQYDLIGNQAYSITLSVYFDNCRHGYCGSYTEYSPFLSGLLESVRKLQR